MFPLPVVWCTDGSVANVVSCSWFHRNCFDSGFNDYLYPVQILQMLFWGKKHEELVLSPRKLNDPGMLGMLIAVIVLLVAGLPLIVTASSVLLYLYGIFPASWIGWAATPYSFSNLFFTIICSQSDGINGYYDCKCCLRHTPTLPRGWN